MDGIPVAGEKTAALLVFLALNPANIHPREIVADTLWPELPAHRARRALSDLLYRLRRVLGPESFISHPTHIGMNPAVVQTDVAEFLQLAESTAEAGLRMAIERYSGPLAPELYDDWISPRRIALHERFLNALAKAGELAEADGRFDAALSYYQHLIEADPLQEAAHRGVMRALARHGRPAEALDAFSRLQDILHRELSIPPSATTRALADAIRGEAETLPPRVKMPSRLPFMGRAAERAAALGRVEEMLAGRGGGLAIEGSPGLGKSRLWEEVESGAHWRGAEVLVARVNEYPTALPLDPLCDLLNRALRGPRAAQVETIVPAEILASLGELYPPWRGRAELPELPPPQARVRQSRDLAVTLTTLAGLSPLLLILDDMHWAAPALWESLDALLNAASTSRLLIGLAYRRPDIERTEGWPFLQRWEREGTLSVLSLKPLAAAEIVAALPPTVPDPAAVAAVSGGNPFYLTQAVIVSREGKVLADAERLLPDRLAALQPADYQALAEASILGVVVGHHHWSAVSDLSPVTLIECAERLVAQQFIEPMDDGYSFAHDLIHTAVYDTLAPERRQELHGRAAAAVAERETGNPHALAFHLDRSGQTEMAAAAYRAAGKLDLATFSFAEALAAFERALELWPNDRHPVTVTARIETLFDVASICDSIGARERQQTGLEEAQRLAHRLEHDAYVLRAHIGLGRLAAVTGQVEKAESHLKAALVLAENVADGALAFEAYFYSGDLDARRGRLDDARRQFQKALDMASSRSDTLQAARALRGLSIVARLNGDPAGALTLIENALKMQMAGGDLFGASVTQSNRLATLYDLGAWDLLLTLAGEALALKEKIGDRHGAAIMRYMQGLAAHSLGDPVLARNLIEAAEHELLAVGDRRTAGLARNVLGLVAESEGRFDEAQADFEAAIAEAETTGASTEAGYARHDLGMLLARRGRPQEAIPLLEAARAVWQEQGNELLRLKSETWVGLASLTAAPERAASLAAGGWAAFQRGIPPGEAPQAWLWALQNLLAGLQRFPEAQAVLQAACREVWRQAEGIRDVTQRRNFLEQVTLNREIVAAYGMATGRQHTVSHTLARTDPSTGRTDEPDRITIIWTLSSPEDAQISNPAERRRHVLLRLLAEATQQGAAPTGDDLAAALGVSRRTILRDMDVLSQMGRVPVGRRRRI